MAKQTTTRPSPIGRKIRAASPPPPGKRTPLSTGTPSHNYFLLEKFEAGVVLDRNRSEIRPRRAGNLKDAYGLIKDGELWLLNCHIGPYEHGNFANHAPCAPANF